MKGFKMNIEQLKNKAEVLHKLILDMKTLEDSYIKYFKDLMKRYIKSMKELYPDKDYNKSLKKIIRKANEELNDEGADQR